MILGPVILATTIATVAQPPPMLCIAERCRPTNEIRVPSAENVRPFVWISADASRVVAGTIAAGATAVPVMDETRVLHTLTLATSDGSRTVPQFRLRCGEGAWNWSIAQIPKSAIELRHAPEDCNLTIASEGYATVEKPLVTKDLGHIYLRRLPVISGIVTDGKTGVPVAGAQILLPGGELLVTTDQAGTFRVPDRQRVAVVASSRCATARGRTVLVPKAVADVHLPITLPPGGSVVLALEPPLGGEDVSWEARLVIDDRTEEKVRLGSVAAGEATVTIDRLEPGPYRFLVRGDGPLQRVVVPVSVSDGVTTEASVRIESARLALEVTRGGNAYGGAEVELIFQGGLWRSKLTTDEQGRAVEELWQRGDYIAAVQSWTDSRRLDEDDLAWKLDLPDRVIRGRVTDAATSGPVPNAMVILDLNGSKAVERTSADGTYVFKTVSLRDVHAQREKLGPPESANRSSCTRRRHSGRGARSRAQPVSTGRTLRAFDRDRGSAAGRVGVRSPSRDGTRASRRRPRGRTRHVAGDRRRAWSAAFVLPRSGFLGMTRFASSLEGGDDELVVRVPDGTASLEVQTQSTDGRAHRRSFLPHARRTAFSCRCRSRRPCTTSRVSRCRATPKVDYCYPACRRDVMRSGRWPAAMICARSRRQHLHPPR